MPADARTSAATCLLGDAGYTVALSATGAGRSRWNGRAVTRWRMGGRGGEQGGYVYVRDTADRAAWAATPLPCGGAVGHWFDDAMARFARRDGVFTTTLEIVVDPDHPVEVRGVGIHNDGAVEREIELTS
ncbi:MAG TPA: hypothetical protein VIM92_07880, partial [Rhodanobacteraceae bacterium]